MQEYTSVFEKLLLEECAALLLRGQEEGEVLLSQQAVVSRCDERNDASLALCVALPAGATSSFAENDVLLLSRDDPQVLATSTCQSSAEDLFKESSRPCAAVDSRRTAAVQGTGWSCAVRVVCLSLHGRASDCCSSLACAVAGEHRRAAPCTGHRRGEGGRAESARQTQTHGRFSGRKQAGLAQVGAWLHC